MTAPNGAGHRPNGPAAGTSTDFEQRFMALVARVLRRTESLRQPERMLGMVTFLALLGGALLVISDFTNLFDIKLKATVIDQTTGGDQHSYAVALIGAAVVGATLVARSTSAWPPAGAVAALGLVVLVIALAADLPDATRSDLVRGAQVADASPALGFWLELAGALVTLTAGGALALALRRGTGPRGPTT